MKIGLVSYAFKNKDIQFNIKQIIKAMTCSPNIDMLCFGEAFLQGFDSLVWKYNIDKSVAITKDSMLMQEIIACARTYHKDLAFGYIEIEDGVLYSSYAVIIEGRLAYNYRRLSKGWKEYNITDDHYQEGNQTVEFFYKNHYIQIALCGDLWWEDALQNRFVAKDILLWPIYVNYTLEEWDKNLKDYICQSALFSNHTLMVNSLSNDPISYGGAFFIENGVLKESTSLGKEEILMVCF